MVHGIVLAKEWLRWWRRLARWLVGLRRRPQSQHRSSCTPFIEFMLEVIFETLVATQETTQENVSDRILDYLRLHPRWHYVRRR
jgi:hypothetical protein